MITIKVKPDEIAIISEEDVSLLSKYNWVLNGAGYACAAELGCHSKSVFMHHLVIGKPTEGFDVHHINGDKLNNTRDNLMFISKSQHQQMKGVQANNSSGYKGVCFVKSRNKWQANININGKTKLVGRFNNVEEAAKAYDKAALEHFGEHAYLNFPCNLTQSKVVAEIKPIA